MELFFQTYFYKRKSFSFLPLGFAPFGLQPSLSLCPFGFCLESTSLQRSRRFCGSPRCSDSLPSQSQLQKRSPLVSLYEANRGRGTAATLTLLPYPPLGGKEQTLKTLFMFYEVVYEKHLFCCKISWKLSGNLEKSGLP